MVMNAAWFDSIDWPSVSERARPTAFEPNIDVRQSIFSPPSHPHPHSTACKGWCAQWLVGWLQGPEDVSYYGRVRHPPAEGKISPAQAKVFDKMLKDVPMFVDAAKAAPLGSRRAQRKQGPPWPDRPAIKDDSDDATEADDPSFTFAGTGPLGLKFSDVGSQVTIHEITSDGLGAQHIQAGLRPGLILKSVGTRSVLGLNFNEAIQLINKTPHPLTLTFEQPIRDKSGVHSCCRSIIVSCLSGN